MYSYLYQSAALFMNQFMQTFSHLRPLTENCLCFEDEAQIWTKYCLCGVDGAKTAEIDFCHCRDSREDDQIQSVSQGDVKLESVHERAKRRGLPDIDTNLLKLLKLISSNKNVEFVRSDKSSKGLHNGVSNRRSQFIGVLKNGNRWQVLINEGRVKKYIGTYRIEKEAAIIHDFYCIGINGKKAKTNFTYSKEMLQRMIESYFSNDKHFEPSEFASQV